MESNYPLYRCSVKDCKNNENLVKLWYKFLVNEQNEDLVCGLHFKPDDLKFILQPGTSFSGWISAFPEDSSTNKLMDIKKVPQDMVRWWSRLPGGTGRPEDDVDVCNEEYQFLEKKKMLRRLIATNEERIVKLEKIYHSLRKLKCEGADDILPVLKATDGLCTSRGSINFEKMQTKTVELWDAFVDAEIDASVFYYSHIKSDNEWLYGWELADKIPDFLPDRLKDILSSWIDPDAWGIPCCVTTFYFLHLFNQGIDAFDDEVDAQLGKIHWENKRMNRELDKLLYKQSLIE